MKNFNDIYFKVVEESARNLESLRKKLLSKIVFVIMFFVFLNAFSILIMILTNVEFVFAFFINILVSIILFYKMIPSPVREYYIAYKENVVKKFVNAYDENLFYVSNGTIPEKEYYSAGFETGSDVYYSEDIITGTIDNHKIIMGEVHTSNQDTTEETVGATTTIFYGIFGDVKIQNKYSGEINVYLHKGRQSQISPEHKKIEMDSTEFEKYFDVYADDKIQAMQVLTSDVMEEMMEFIKESKIKFEFTIKKDKFYIRFWTDEMFEGNILKSSVEFDTLKKVFDVINFTFDITRKIIKVTEETTI